MSSYVEFYLKDCKKGFYTHMCGYSRSSSIYQIFYNTFGYNTDSDNNCRVLTKEDLRSLISEISDHIQSTSHQIEEILEDIKNLASWNNQIDDKMEYYSDWKQTIELHKENIEDYKFARSCFSFLLNMLEDNSNLQIYAGIDCGMQGEEDEDINE